MSTAAPRARFGSARPAVVVFRADGLRRSLIFCKVCGTMVELENEDEIVCQAVRVLSRPRDAEELSWRSAARPKILPVRFPLSSASPPHHMPNQLQSWHTASRHGGASHGRWRHLLLLSPLNCPVGCKAKVQSGEPSDPQTRMEDAATAAMRDALGRNHRERDRCCDRQMRCVLVASS